MKDFNYSRPATVAEACQLLTKHGAQSKILAGGTDLLVQFREENPKWQGVNFVVDITNLNELRFIREENGLVEIGPLTTHTDLANSPLLQKKAPFLCAAAFSVGSPQIRNRGTIGGSLCNASPAADPIIPLVVLDAVVTIVGPCATRELPLKDVIAKPYETTLAPDELITKITFKAPSENVATAFLKVGRRKALSISRMNIAVALSLDLNGAINTVAIAPGCVFSVPDRVSSVEEILLGKTPNQTLLTKAGEVMAAEMIARTGLRPSSEYKKPALAALTKQCLEKALEAYHE